MSVMQCTNIVSFPAWMMKQTNKTANNNFEIRLIPHSRVTIIHFLALLNCIIALLHIQILCIYALMKLTLCSYLVAYYSLLSLLSMGEPQLLGALLWAHVDTVHYDQERSVWVWPQAASHSDRLNILCK